jgi:TatD DNase family protein
MLVDSHCHLDDEQFQSDREAAIGRALEAGVHQMIAIGTGEGPPDLEAGIRLAEAHDCIRATAGIHPQYASQATDGDVRRVAELLNHPKVVGMGEIGIDYHWEPYDRDRQHAIFIEQMAIARDARKPIIIHTRDAWDDTFALLEQQWAPAGLPCILHCFTGTAAQARRALALGFYLSFAGVVTYPKATDVHESARIVPLDRLLVETDSPYLPPVPYRGKRNEPSYVVHTARRVAELRGESFETIAAVTTENVQRLFGGAGTLRV